MASVSVPTTPARDFAEPLFQSQGRPRPPPPPVPHRDSTPSLESRNKPAPPPRDYIRRHSEESYSSRDYDSGHRGRRTDGYPARDSGYGSRDNGHARRELSYGARQEGYPAPYHFPGHKPKRRDQDPVHPGVRSNTFQDWQQQLEAYRNWVNSQLRKVPANRHVEELRSDMRDGVAFAQLIHILAGERLVGVHPSPATAEEMRENTERVLHFIAARRIKLSPTSPHDIVEGNVKSIMRLILALAAHYKPSSVRSQQRITSRTPSFSGLAHDAAAALAEARRDMARAGPRPARPRGLGPDTRYPATRYSSSSDHYSDSDPPPPPRRNVLRPRSALRPSSTPRGEVEGASAGSQSPVDGSCPSSHHSRSSTPRHGPPGPKQGALGSSGRPSPLNSSRSEGGGPWGDHRGRLAKAQSLEYVGDDGVDWRGAYEESREENVELAEHMLETKKALLQLQLMLVSELPEDEQTTGGEGSETTNSHVVVLRSRLQLATELCGDLKEELARSKADLVQLQGEKNELEKRLEDAERVISQHQSPEHENEGRVKSGREEALQEQVDRLTEKLQRVTLAEASLASKLECQDELMSRLGGSLHLSNTTPFPAAFYSDLKRLHEAITRLQQDHRDTATPDEFLLNSVQRQLTALLDEQHPAAAALRNGPPVLRNTQAGSRHGGSNGGFRDVNGEASDSRDRMSSDRSDSPPPLPNRPPPEVLKALPHHAGTLPTFTPQPQGTSTPVNRPRSPPNLSTFKPRSVDQSSSGSESRAAPFSRSRSGSGSVFGSQAVTPSSTTFPANPGPPVPDWKPGKRPSVPPSYDQSVAVRRGGGGLRNDTTPAPHANGGPGIVTKITYFLDDKLNTPLTCVIPKRLGEIHLADFKRYTEKQEGYRYHFKALDPEYGTVRQELVTDDSIVPGWDNKVVAWLERDTV